MGNIIKNTIFILLNIYSNITNNADANLMKLYYLPKILPYFQSELLYQKIIMNLTYESSLYFLFLQLNLNIWFLQILGLK